MDLVKELRRYHDERDWTKEPYSNERIDMQCGISLLEGQTYYALVRHFKPTLIVELGTNMGNSTRFMAKALRYNLKHEGHAGTLHTVDHVEFDHRAKNKIGVVTHKSDAIDFLTNNYMIMKDMDFFSHDDAHGKDHIMAEVDIVKLYRPKVMAFHDSQTESKPFWDYVMANPQYLPEYDRFEVKSLMGIGILVRTRESVDDKKENPNLAIKVHQLPSLA